MNYSLINADRNTHLKIVLVALACSVLVGFAFNGSLFAAPASKPQLVDVTFVANTAHRTVCRIDEL
jgi:hypothetical protein